jgi:hypothetical protein
MEEKRMRARRSVSLKRDLSYGNKFDSGKNGRNQKGASTWKAIRRLTRDGDLCVDIINPKNIK